jgi:hypothetical protein
MIIRTVKGYLLGGPRIEFRYVTEVRGFSFLHGVQSALVPILLPNQLTKVKVNVGPVLKLIKHYSIKTYDGVYVSVSLQPL